MASIQELGFPAKWLLRYINAELAKYDEMGMIDSDNFMAMFPTNSPTSTEELYNNLIQNFNAGEPLMIMWDRLMRFRPSPLYVHKREQLLLFLHTSDHDKLMAANIIISQALDREDVSAQEVNKWMADNKTTLEPVLGELNIFFRNIKVYQADETRDVVELASARTLFVNKIIVEYDYHVYKHDPEDEGLTPVYS
jgi:hypothetical protein